MKKLRIMTLVLIASVLTTIPVLAQAYIVSVTVSESADVSYEMLPIVVSVDNQYLADNGYISTNGTDTRVLEASTPMPHMLADDKLLFSSAVGANEQPVFSYTFGNDALDNFYIISGYGGYITVADDDDLELDDSFEVEIKGYIDISAGSDKNLVYKASAFKLYISAEGSIKAEITGGTSVTATGISSGEMTILVKADGFDLEIYIEGNLEDTSALGEVGVPNNVNNWKLLENDVMPYVEYIKIRVG